MIPVTAIDRREFLKLTSEGLVIVFSIGAMPADAWQEPARLPGRPAYPSDVNAYIHVGPDGRVTALVGKVELGQGSMTALPMLLADELDVDLAAIDIVLGDTDLCPWDVGTFGSLTIRQFGPVFRAAGAEARAALLELAAERLNAPVDTLLVERGTVWSTRAPGTRVTYAQLVGGKRIERKPATRPPVKPAAALRVVGRTAARRDAREKVTGTATYAGDMRLPGMLQARIVRPPAHGATPRSVDTSAAEKIAGVRVVRDGDLVAVLHQHRDVADAALALVKAEYDRHDLSVDDESIFEHVVRHAPAGQTLAEHGSLQQAQADAQTTFEQTYVNSYVAHAPIETHSALAAWENGRVTVWASTQAPFGVKSQVAQRLGVDPQQVRIITPYVGGGFGGKSGALQAVEAARLARAVGAPVMVVWDRREEFFYDTFRPAAVVKIRSGLTRTNRIAFWDFDVYCAGDREAVHFYSIPNDRTVSHGGWSGNQPPGLHPFGVGPWRAPSVNTNTFARESQIDIMAAAAKVDPVEFRIAHAADPRMIRVIKAAAERFGWAPKPAPSGRGVAMAAAMYSGTYVASFAEIDLNRATGHVQVTRVVCAQDMGLVVNPDGAQQQTEGSIMMGLGYALTEEVRFKNSEVLHDNFDSYELPHFTWMPKIETVFLNTPDQPWQGCGEPPIVTMGAVIANAIFDATGRRLFQLPITPARVKAAL